MDVAHMEVDDVGEIPFWVVMHMVESKRITGELDHEWLTNFEEKTMKLHHSKYHKRLGSYKLGESI